MTLSYSRHILWFAGALAAAVVFAGTASAQQGLVLSGVGPINRSMGGASVAAPIDPSGALYWNPASITGLKHSEIEFGLDLIYPQTQLSSNIGPFGGSTNSDTGIFLVPTLGFVYQEAESPWTVGLGVFGTAGFGVNYPQDNNNPLLLPTPPRGPGLGALYSNLQVIQIVPTVAVRLNDNLSVGVAPTLTLATLSADPSLLSTPDIVGGGTLYPSATHGQTTWGGGVQAGVFYTTDTCWAFGASIKSPQWLDTFRYHSVDPLTGRNRTLKIAFDYPMILGVGTSYTGFERLVLAGDLHWFDYSNTTGFRSTGFDQTGAVRGLGWKSILEVALGAQYQVSDALSVRLGYTWNQNPISGPNTIFNVISPNILQNTIAVGATYQVTPCWGVSLAYLHGFQNTVTGPIVTPLGPIPASAVTSRVSADGVIFGLNVKF